MAILERALLQVCTHVCASYGPEQVQVQTLITQGLCKQWHADSKCFNSQL